MHLWASHKRITRSLTSQYNANTDSYEWGNLKGLYDYFRVSGYNSGAFWILLLVFWPNQILVCLQRVNMMIWRICMIVTEQSHVLKCRMLCILYFVAFLFDLLLFQFSICRSINALWGILFRFGLARFSASGDSTALCKDKIWTERSLYKYTNSHGSLIYLPEILEWQPQHQTLRESHC